jgi:hypothetical protein
VVLLNSRTILYIPPVLLHATYTVAGGLIMVTRFITRESLSFAACELDSKLDESYDVIDVCNLLVAVKLCRELEDGELKQAASLCLCERYGKI